MMTPFVILLSNVCVNIAIVSIFDGDFSKKNNGGYTITERKRRMDYPANPRQYNELSLKFADRRNLVIFVNCLKYYSLDDVYVELIFQFHFF